MIFYYFYPIFRVDYSIRLPINTSIEMEVAEVILNYHAIELQIWYVSLLPDVWSYSILKQAY